jgi:hypothetical protein
VGDAGVDGVGRDGVLVVGELGLRVVDQGKTVCFQVRPPSYDVEAATPLRASVASNTRPLALTVPSGPVLTQPSDTRW